MISLISKPSKFRKVVSVLLAFTFLSYNVSYAGPKELAPPNIPLEKTALEVDDIGIGIDTGTIKSTYSGNTGKTIIHIQDAHCNFEAQSNINKILDQLTKECGINMISVEGAEGIVDTAWFRAFPDAEIRQEVATYFMKKGEITGAEFFSINSDYPGVIYGAETREYYIKNLKAFTDVYPYKETIEKYFSDLRVVAQRLKALIYTPQLKELDLKIRGFDKKDIELSDFAAYLEKVCKREKIDVQNYPNFKKLLQTLEYEDKIDFDIVDQERSQYIDLLGKKLPKEEMTELVAQSIKFKKGHIKAVDFYFYLRELAKEKKIDMVNEFPNLFYYYIYTKLYDGIDNEGLFKELNAIQLQLKDKLFRSDDERQLDKTAKIIDMFVDLVNIELTNDDYDLFKTYSKEYSLEDVVAFISMLSNRYNLNYNIDPLSPEISEKLPNMVDFYEIAMIRDEALIDNTIKKMDEDGKDRCIFIAGGFHTRGIKKLLEKKGISYVVITPKITKDVETPYIKVLTNQRTTLEDIITDSGPMPTAGKQMATPQGSKMLAAFDRLEVGLPFTEEGVKTLKQISEEIGSVTGEDEDTYAARVMELYTNARKMGIVGIDDEIGKVKGWIEKKKEEFGDEWNNIVANDAEWESKVVRQLVDGVVKSLGEIESITTSEKEQMLKAFHIIREVVLKEAREKELMSGKGTRSPGQEHADIEKTEHYDDIQAQNINEAIKKTLEGTLKDGRSFIVPHDKTGGTFYVLDDAEYQKWANEFGAPETLVCHPGTDGTRASYDPARHEATYPLVKKNYYIRKSAYLRMNQAERDTLAQHEKLHIDIALQIMRPGFKVPEGIQEEDYINTKFDIRPILEKMRTLLETERNLLNNNEYGDAVAEYITMSLKEIASLEKQGKDTSEAIEKYNKEIVKIANRQINLDAVQKLLLADKWEGHDVIVVVSPSEDERKYQEEFFKKLFKGIETNNKLMKNKLCVLSVLDDSNGGQLIGQVYALEQAEKQFAAWAQKNGIEETDLAKLQKERKVTLAVYHNGGQGSRFAPGSQSEITRENQDLFGKIITKMGEEVDLTLFPGVVLSTARLALSNPGGKIDTIWVNQIGIGSTNFADIQRTDNQFNKLAFGMPRDPDAKDVHDYGMGLVVNGELYRFYGNKTFAKLNPETGLYEIVDQETVDMLTKVAGNQGVFDFGSFSMDYDLHEKIAEYWRDVRGIITKIESAAPNVVKKAGISRDIDSAMVQIMVPLMSGLKGIDELPDGLPAADTLKNMKGDVLSDEKVELLEDAYNKIIAAIQETATEENGKDDLIGDLNKIYEKKKDVVLETLDFFLINRDMLFENPTKPFAGIIDMGEDSHWFAYKRVIDMANEKFIMLNDISGKIIKLGPRGLLRNDDGYLPEAGIMDKIKAMDSRAMRGIRKTEIATYIVNGKKYTVSLDQMSKGKMYVDYENDITIENSVITGFTVLKPGSRIKNSALNNVQGKIIADYSFLNEVIVPEMTIEEGVANNVSDKKAVNINKRMVLDVFRPQFKTQDSKKLDLPDGQGRVDVSLGYDAKGKEVNDKNKYDEDDRFTLEQIRGMEFNRNAVESRMENIRENLFQRLFSRKTFVKVFNVLKFGTSGLRSLVTDFTDMEVYINTIGFVRHLEEVGDVKPGDTITVGGDLRPSTPRIMKAVAKAIEDAGYEVDLIGQLPSPAISYRGVLTGNASVVVTGSHIPFNRTGIKFNRANGEEVLKTDEPGIKKNVALAREAEYDKSWKETIFGVHGYFKSSDVTSKYDLNESYEEARQAYIDRYVNAFPAGILKGKNIKFYQHSSVGRDINVDILRALGANVETVDRTGYFVPIDTEKVSKDMKKYLKRLASTPMKNGEMPDAVISQDGDADRPLVASNKGNFVPGDKLGALVSLFLSKNNDIKKVSFPTSAVDVVPAIMKANGIDANKTDIGSPFVIEDMNYQAKKLAEAAKEARPDEADKYRNAFIAGWEANGGYMLGSDITIKGGKAPLKRLATRDAILPMVSILAYAAQEKQDLETFFDEKLRHPETGEHRFNGAGVYDKFEKEFGVDDAGAWELMAITKDSVVPQLVDDKFLASVDFVTGDVEQSVGITYDRDIININDISKADKEAWDNLKVRLEKLLEPKGFKNIKAIEALSRREKDANGDIVFKYLAGTKILFDDGRVMHLRPSGNATEFRVYATANTEKEVDGIIAAGEKTIPEIAKGAQESAAGSPGTQAAKLGVPLVSKLDRVLEKMKRTKEYDEAIDKKAFKKAIIALHGQIMKGKPLQQKTYFRLGLLNNYKWGQPIDESSILNAMGRTELGDKIDFLYDNLTIGQMNKLKAAYTIKEVTGTEVDKGTIYKIFNIEEYKNILEKGFEIPSVQENAFISWAKDFLSKEIVAERWFGAGDIVIGDQRLPVEILRLWPGEVFGDELVDFTGAENIITAKHLASSNELSVQMHAFDEVITATQDGFAYFGLKKNMKPQQIKDAAENGEMKNILNKIELKKGETYIVPAYTIHAYGAGVVVDETKAVSKAKDAVGTISFGDDLAKNDVQNERITEIMDMTLSDKEKKDMIIKEGLLRENKDFRTMSPDKIANTLAWLEKAKAKGSLDGRTPEEVKAMLKAPDYGTPKTGTRFEPKAIVAGSLIAGNYVIDQNSSIEVEDTYNNKLHALVVFEGSVKIEMQNGEEFTLEEGQDVLMRANMGDYTIVAQNGPALVSAKVVNTPESIEQVEVLEGKNNVTAEFQNPGGKQFSNVVDKIEIGTGEKVNALDVIPLIVKYNQEHTILVTQGTLEVAIIGDVEDVRTVERGDKLTISSKQLKLISENKLRYEFRNPSDALPVVFKIDYEKTDTEKTAYAAFEMVKKHYAKITETLDESKVVIITRAELYVAGNKDVVGSVAWEQNLLDEAFGKNRVEIRPYSLADYVDFNGAMDAVLLGKRPRKDEKTGKMEKFVLAATGKDLKSVNAKIADELKKLRIIALPDNVGDKEVIKNGWALATAVESTALLQAALKVETFTTENDYVEDMKSLMERLTDKSLSVQDLYYMLPFSDLGKTSFYKKLSEEAETEEENALLRLFMNNLVARLGLKPIEPFDPRAELQSRLKVMYSA